LQLKKTLFFGSIIGIFLIPRLPERTPKLQERLSALKTRTSSASKKEISSLISIFVGNFCPPDQKSMRIQRTSFTGPGLYPIAFF
jgi:hypothetical protein